MQEINKILVISDSHGFEGNVRKIIEKNNDIDMLIHLGDFESGMERIQSMVSCETHFVPGNNDFGSGLDRDKIIEVNNYRIFLTHGHRYGVYYGMYGLYDKAVENNCDIVLFGHTHRPVVESMGDVTFANPGSISLPRQNYKEPTFMLIEFDKFGDIHYSIGKM